MNVYQVVTQRKSQRRTGNRNVLYVRAVSPMRASQAVVSLLKKKKQLPQTETLSLIFIGPLEN